VSGSWWHSCGAIQIALPAPWGVARFSSTDDRFTYQYPVPVVKPYAGRVVVTQAPCDGETGLQAAATDIVVGDARAMETGP